MQSGENGGVDTIDKTLTPRQRREVGVYYMAVSIFTGISMFNFLPGAVMAL